MLSVIVDDTRDPVRNLALDEAMVRAASPGLVARVWQNDPSVIIGRFQRPGAAVDMVSCARDGIPVLRRASGGGAVFTGPGTLNVTLVGERPADEGALRRVLGTVVAGFGHPLPLTEGVLKIAVMRTGRRVLVHGCLQVTTVLAYGRDYLPGDSWTLADRGLSIGLDALRTGVFTALVERYGTAPTRRPTATECEWRDHLLNTRYGDISWHLMGTGQRGRVNTR